MPGNNFQRGRKRGKKKKKTKETSPPSTSPPLIVRAEEGPGPGTPTNNNAEVRKNPSVASCRDATVVPESWEDELDTANEASPSEQQADAGPAMSEASQDTVIVHPGSNATHSEDGDLELEDEYRDQLTELPSFIGIGQEIGGEGIVPRSMLGVPLDGIEALDQGRPNSAEMTTVERIYELEEELLASREQVDIWQREDIPLIDHSAMEGDLETAHRMAETRSRQLAQVQVVMQEMEEKTLALENDLVLAGREKEFLLSENSSLKQQLDGAPVLGEGDLAAELSSTKQKCARLEEELSDTNELAREQSKVMIEHENQAQELIAHIKELEAALENAETSEQEKAKEVEVVLQAMEQSKLAAAELEAEVFSASKAAADKEEAILELETECRNLKGQNSSLARRIQELQSQDLELRASISQRDEALGGKTAPIQGNVSRKDFQNQKKAYEASLAEKEESLRAIASDLEKREAVMQEMVAAMEEKDLGLSSMNIALEEKEESLRSLRAAVDEFARQNEELIQNNEREAREQGSKMVTLEASLVQAEEDMVEMRVDCLQQHEHLEACQAALHEANELAESLKKEGAETSGRISDLTAELAACKQESEGFRGRAQEAEEKLAKNEALALGGKVAELEKALKESEDEAEFLRSKMAEMEGQLVESRDGRQDSEDFKNLAREQQAKMADMERSISSLEEEVKRFELESSAQGEKASALEAALEQSQEETKSVRNKLKAAIKKGKRIEQDKQQLEVQHAETLAQAEVTAGTLVETEKLLGNCQEQLAAMETLQGATIAEASSELQQQIQSLEEVLAGKMQEINELKNTAEGLESKLKAAVKKGKRISQDKQELEARMADLEGARTELENRSSHSQEEIVALQMKLKEYDAMDVPGMQLKASQAESQLADLVQELDHWRESFAKLEAEASEALSKCTALEAEVMSKGQELESASREKSELEEKFASAEAKCLDLDRFEELAREAKTRMEEMVAEEKKMQNEVAQHRTKVARARDAVEHIKEEKNQALLQVEELSERIMMLELSNVELQEMCENSREFGEGSDEGRPPVDPDLDDWVHRALHAEKRATEAESQKHAEIGVWSERASTAERGLSTANERIQSMDATIKSNSQQILEKEQALEAAMVRNSELEKELTAAEHHRESSNPPSAANQHDGVEDGVGLNQELFEKLGVTYEAAKSLAGQMGLPFYEASSGGDDANGESALDAVRILLEGIGFGMQRQQRQVEEQKQQLSIFSSIQNELNGAREENDRLTRELERQRRQSSGGSGHLALEISSPPVEPVPSAGTQKTVSIKRRELFDIESGRPSGEDMEDAESVDSRSEFLPLTTIPALKQAPGRVNQLLALLDRASVASGRILNNKPAVRLGVAAYAIVLHLMFLLCLMR
ncbi:hypothetical protein BSKO_06199 [Bryopsis sp. KO-2023]|nr:hypothetical protein BSKO_06199 [Bryopsis sp. KO-2023]